MACALPLQPFTFLSAVALVEPIRKENADSSPTIRCAATHTYWSAPDESPDTHVPEAASL